MKLLEVCVDSLASAQAAAAGGADRLEVCSALAIGGLTPYLALVEKIKEDLEISVRCLMRPRAGDFLYEPEEIAMLCTQIRQLSNAGADGFVFGCLTPEGVLDLEAMKPLIDACDGKGMTLHRAVDVSRDPVDTWQQAGKLGIDTVLTSGGAGNCLRGMETIGRMLALREADGGPEVLIGAGVKAAVIRQFREKLPNARSFHMSGKTEVPSGMLFRREGVPMGLPGLDEWHISRTSQELIHQARNALDANYVSL